MFAAALAQTEDAVRVRVAGTASRRRLSRAITLIDSMLAILESSNLTGSVPASGSIEAGISALRQMAPDQCEINLGFIRRPEKLMDELFAVQQRLLMLRAGPDWDPVYADEQSETSDPWVIHSGA